jgi:hypothetical protein
MPVSNSGAASGVGVLWMIEGTNVGNLGVRNQNYVMCDTFRRSTVQSKGRTPLPDTQHPRVGREKWPKSSNCQGEQRSKNES